MSQKKFSVYHSLEGIPAGLGPSVLAIGNFDGVHRGHQQILTAVVAEARAKNARALAMTFDPHPEQFLFPDRAPKLLTPISERLRRMAACGLDAVLVLPFDKELAAMPARRFLDEVLIGKLGLCALHEGANFCFGRHAEAGVAELKQWGTKLGFVVHVHDVVKVRGLEVSSTAIRERVASGDIRRARWMLGRPFSVLATQTHGRGVGHRLLVPTINLADYQGLLPSFGVYVTHLRVGDRRFQAVTNVGNRPTFAGAGFCVESYILDFAPVEMTDTTPIEIEFLFRLRGEKLWPTPEALKSQIMKDVARADTFFRRLHG